MFSISAQTIHFKTIKKKHFSGSPCKMSSNTCLAGMFKFTKHTLKRFNFNNYVTIEL